MDVTVTSEPTTTCAFHRGRPSGGHGGYRLPGPPLPEHAPNGMAIPIALSLLPGVALFTIFILVPLGVLVVTSFAQWSVLGLHFTGTANYGRLIHDSIFWKAFTNTALYAAVGILIQVPIGIAVGMILAQRIRGWRDLPCRSSSPRSSSPAPPSP